MVIESGPSTMEEEWSDFCAYFGKPDINNRKCHLKTHVENHSVLENYFNGSMYWIITRGKKEFFLFFYNGMTSVWVLEIMYITFDKYGLELFGNWSTAQTYMEHVVYIGPKTFRIQIEDVRYNKILYRVIKVLKCKMKFIK